MCEGTIAELMGSSVGRRWLLKAGLGAGAAAWAMPSWAAAGPSPLSGLVAGVGPSESRVLQFALGAAAEVDDLTLHANGQRVPLSPHTPLTRMRLLGEGSLWRKLRRGRLTHFAEVELPAERGLVVSVRGVRDGQAVVVAQMFHAPAAATRALAAAAFELEGSYRLVAGSPERLAGLGLHHSQLATEDEVADLDSVVDDHQTAVLLTMMHPNVATVGHVEVPATKSLLGQTPEVTTLGTHITQMHQAGQDYASAVPVVDADGNPSQIRVGTQSVALTTVKLNSTDQTFTTTARSAFVAGVRGVRDTGGPPTPLGKVVDRPLDELHDTADTSTWHQPEGVVPTATPYVPPTGEQATVDVHVTNPYPTLVYGTYTQVTGALSNRQVPLKLYNNYVRWVSVFVQYVEADGTNLTFNPQPTFPDTRHAKSLGLLPQIFTVLGVPIWDTNTIAVTLDFPPEASKARLLFCGLGDNAIGGGWRQYFPADAYPDHIAPQDEVLFASLMTGILSIGLTAFALLTDLDIATTWAAIRRSNADIALAIDLGETVAQAISGTQLLTAAESFAALVASGGATYEDIANNGGSAANIWNTLLSIGSIIPKIIFNPAAEEALASVAETIVAEEGVDKAIEAIPLIGVVVAVAAAVGDAVTLAEAIGETIASPWVIENEVSLQYAATVTVSPDPRTATPPASPAWPATARSWRIEAKIDGVAALSPQTGTLNTGGGTDTTPIVLHLTAPFAGNTITWSIVVLDAAGHQVATGVSAQLPNNDSTNPPTAVNFAVTELPATITPATVFRRADTTVFNPTVGGYTWSRTVVDTATATNSGIQEVTGVTVSTRLGVAGLVWKQDDRYWLRAVPVAEAGSTITLGGATRNGYARRPFLLFDAFVEAADVANHVLVEPDDTADGYHVRSLTINPATGASELGPHRLAGRIPAARRRRRLALVGTGRHRPHQQRPPRPRPTRRHPATPAGHLRRRARHRDRAALLPNRPRRHQPRHRPRVGSRHLAVGRLRPQRQPGPLLRHHQPRQLHPPPAHRRHLARPRRRRRQPDLPPLPPRRRQPSLRLPHRRLQPHRHPHRHQQPRHQHPPPRRRLLAQHLRRQLQPPPRHHHQPTPHRPHPRRPRTLPQPLRPHMTAVVRVMSAAVLVTVGLVVPVPASAQQDPTPTTVTFQYTGDIQTWTVPAGVLQATFDLYGAQGGSVPEWASGGSGGHTRGTLAVNPGEIVNLLIGGEGGSFNEFQCTSDPFGLAPGAPGGFNGGAPGADAQCAGPGGGGATDVRIGGVDITNRVLVAGGGGGAALRDAGGCAANGGLGGGATGGNGQCGQGGAGGNQTGTTGSGTLGFGSKGTGNIPGCNVIGAGGGGGGYWGGAGGRNNDQCTNAAGGGGGGSAFGAPGTIFESGGQVGHGRIVVSYTTIPRPTISSLSPAGGPTYGTTTVTITGTNLNTDPRGTIVHFGNRAATGVHCASATQCTATSPPGTGTVDVVVEVAGLKSEPGQFRYVPTPVPILIFKQLLAQYGDVSDIRAEVVASAADRAALAGVDLRGVNLTGVSFLGEPVDLTGTRLDGATLTGANLALADLTGATLTNVSAAGATFEGADLSAEGAHPAANLSGANTNLQNADFVNANVSGAKFVGADLTGAVFSGARGVDTDFTGVRARNAVFSDAHLYGNGQAFHGATDLGNVDFTGAVMASDVNESGGFDFTGAPLTGARFDQAVCVACNFTNAALNEATFTGAYLPGMVLAAAKLAGVSFDRAWLYCGSLANDHCAKVPGSEQRWAWPLTLGSEESFGPVPFGFTNLTGVDLSVVNTCPDGKSGASAPAGCPEGHLLPRPSEQPLLPAPCSASAYGGCPTATSTLFQSSSFGDPVAVVPAVPPTWNTALSGEGYFVAFDDATVRRVGAEASVVVAGTSDRPCEDARSPCGDGGPATAALLAQPNGLAVGLDGSLYIADVELHKVRKIDPSGVITTVAGTGARCDDGTCGDGGPATSAELAEPFGVAVDPYGVLLIADGQAGIRRVAVDGTIRTLTPRETGDIYWSVALGADGTIHAATQFPDHIVTINPTSGAATRVVGTGTSGYNGNTNDFGMLLPGTQVQINQPSGLSVDLEGNVVFADTANHLIRAYVPSTGHVIDDLAGVVANGAPTGGFNGDGHWSNETQLHAPLGVTATRGPLLVIADTDNQRVRQVGPSPLDTLEPPPPEVVVSCSTQEAWSCERLPKSSDTGAAANLGTVSINHDGTEFAAGRWLPPVGGRVRFLVVESRPLVPGSYELAFGLAGRGFRRTIQLTQGL